MDAKRLAYWDISKIDWQVECDNIELRVGTSSADIKLPDKIQVMK